MSEPPLILILDDDPDSTGILATLLTATGYRTAYANDVETALEEALTECPAVIIADLSGMGPDALRLLREKAGCQSVPVVMMTTEFGITADAAVSTPLGVAAVVQKPLDLAAVLAAVQVAAERA